MTQHSYIIGAKRSPVAPRDGALAELELHQLAAPVIQSLLKSCDIEPSQINELIVGNALGAGGNPARVIALASGLLECVAGVSLDRQCCSGLDAILLGNDMILSGRASMVIAGGVESYSQRPRRYRKSTGSDALTNSDTDKCQWQEYDQPPFTPWPDRDPNMAFAANQLAEELGIDFDRQNAWTIHSHQKALDATDRMLAETVSMINIEKDTFSRQLSKAVCQRAKRIHGSVSIANTAVAADGAAFCLIVNEELASQYNGRQLKIRNGTTLGADPSRPALAPVTAINAVLERESVTATQLHRAEIMEAYAAQAIACVDKTNIDVSICNVGGGGLARGHPIGASGAILMTRLFSEMRLNGGLGLAAIAAAGGLGTAVLVEAFNDTSR